MPKNEYDYGYLKYAILQFCINEILERSKLNSHLQNEGYSKKFTLADIGSISVHGQSATLILETPKGEKKFKITVDGPLKEK